MERVLSTEERIRRAEEVYRNKGNVGHEPIKSIPKYKNKLIKKMIIQIVVCLRKYIVEEDITIDMERAYIEAVKRETDISHKRLEK